MHEVPVGLLETEEALLPEGLSPDLVARIVDAVELLPDDRREVVERLIWGTETKVEISAAMGISKSGIYRLWSEARATLMAALEDL